MSARRVKELENGCPVLDKAEITAILLELKADLVSLRARYNAHLANAAAHTVVDNANIAAPITVDLGTAE